MSPLSRECPGVPPVPVSPLSWECPSVPHVPVSPLSQECPGVPHVWGATRCSSAAAALGVGSDPNHPPALPWESIDRGTGWIPAPGNAAHVPHISITMTY